MTLYEAQVVMALLVALPICAALWVGLLELERWGARGAGRLADEVRRRSS